MRGNDISNECVLKFVLHNGDFFDNLKSDTEQQASASLYCD